MSLSEIIVERIRNEGPISFYNFMEMCLYYPEFGYYTSAKNKIGANGDYYTSPNLSPAFGAMMARQIEEMWRFLGEKEFTIVEYGAGTGLLCHDILNYLKDIKSLYDNLCYCIIEKSPVMRELEKMLLNEKVKWYDSISDVAEFNGCILSNELVDNLSVHQVVMGKELMEVFVDYNYRFMETLTPAKKALKDYINELGILLPSGFRTEINLDALYWIKDIESRLNKGFVITIDYGYSSSELINEARKEGTIMCYHKHQVNSCPYINIGEQDITSHVNFSALSHWGLKSGLDICGFIKQGAFLIGLGIADYLKDAEENGRINYSNEDEKMFIVHHLLIDMGNKFKVLVQQKGIPQYRLSGLTFSGNNYPF